MLTRKLEQRILVVENDERVRKRLTEILPLEGYRVYAANNNDIALVQEAEDLLARARVHLAILDARLLNDNDPEDRSGYELAVRIQERYSGMACIFFSGYRDFDIMREALEKGLVSHVVLKQDVGWDGLLQVIKQVFTQNIRCNWSQMLTGAEPLLRWRALQPLRAMTDAKLDARAQAQEFRELIARLFPDAERVQLQLLNQAAEPGALAHTHSLLLRATPYDETGSLEEVVVKIGSIPAIEAENQNYARFVHQRVVANRHTQREATARTWHLGGIVYSLVGTELNQTKTLEQFYRDAANSSQDLAQVFQNLFQHTFQRWYSKKQLVEINLAQEYSAALGVDDARLERSGLGEQELLALKPLTRHIANPRIWLAAHARDSQAKATRHIVHGDLHSRNLLVGPNRDVWLIDFERTGPGQGLRDFVEMETDIKFHLLALKAQEAALFARMEIALLGQTKKGLAHAPTAPPEVRAQPQLARVFDAITQLRRLARAEICAGNLRDYFWGLFVQTLFVTTLRHVPPEAKARAQLSAALLCARLSDGKKLGAPQELETFLATRANPSRLPHKIR